MTVQTQEIAERCDARTPEEIRLARISWGEQFVKAGIATEAQVKCVITTLEKDDAEKETKNQSSNLTVCPECRVDDFCHMEGCALAAGSK